MPSLVRIKPPGGESYVSIKRALRSNGLATVCEEAHCPNIDECWSSGTATIMLMGGICTRGCRFCSVGSGKPLSLDLQEPIKVASVLKEWGLKYVVLTSVCRDDVPDGGASHFMETIRMAKRENPGLLVEALIPDFSANEGSLKIMADSGADVISHNIETVERLTGKVRDARAGYRQSLFVLKRIKEMSPRAYTKSSIMVGLGETDDEIEKAMDDLRKASVDFLTIGQYLRPTRRNLGVEEHITFEKFSEYKEIGERKGFLYVASGPMVRSSYKAGEFFIESLVKSKANV
ncbi:MAG: lipoyl synthase [Candidatus Aenigmarchaeota archaeon]|nr:lipoyl synthase [Candidatus Aenigmarchaeota archaeon]